VKCLTLFTDGCTDFLFEKAVPNPHYVFRLTNIQSADGVMAAIAAAQAWPGMKKIAHIHPDYSYGRNAFDHFNIVDEEAHRASIDVVQGWRSLAPTDSPPTSPRRSRPAGSALRLGSATTSRSTSRPSATTSSRR
jgi:branched-chain amino acid transport system substrate-binding protein